MDLLAQVMIRASKALIGPELGHRGISFWNNRQLFGFSEYFSLGQSSDSEDDDSGEEHSDIPSTPQPPSASISPF